MLLLLLLAFFIHTNSRLAKKKGKNPLVWGVITFFAFLASLCLLGVIYISIIYRGPMTQEALKAYMQHTPLVNEMLTMLGVGGVLLVRFILERGKGSEAA